MHLRDEARSRLYRPIGRKTTFVLHGISTCFLACFRIEEKDTKQEKVAKDKRTNARWYMHYQMTWNTNKIRTLVYISVWHSQRISHQLNDIHSSFSQYISFFAKMFKQASNRNNDPAGIRRIKSDLIDFTYKMNTLRAETHTAQD